MTDYKCFWNKMFQYRVVITLVILLTGNTFFESLSAQSAAQTSLFSQNVLPYNPAYAGTRLGLNLDASARYQWLDIEGAPVSQFGSIHMAAPGINAGAGLIVVNDAIGAENNLSVRLSLAKAFKLRFGTISFGLDAGIAQKNLDGALIVTNDGEYTGVIQHNDDLIPNSSQNGVTPDIGLGVLFKLPKTLVGLSVRSLIDKEFQLTENESIVEAGRTYFGLIQQNIEVGYNFELIPSLLLKSDAISHQIDLQLAAVYLETFQLGLGYRGYNNRTQDAVVLLAGYRFTPNFKLFYSYDIGLSGLNTAHSGSHELAISYRLADLMSSRGGKVIYNPRFL